MSILVNAIPTKEYIPKNGLRQGDLVLVSYSD